MRRPLCSSSAPASVSSTVLRVRVNSRTSRKRSSRAMAWGQPGLGDVQAGGRAPEMQLIDDGGEVPQIAELDPRGPAIRRGAGKAHDALPGQSRLSRGQVISFCSSQVMNLTCGDAYGLSAAHRHLLE